MTQQQLPASDGPEQRIPRSVYVLTGCVGVIGANSLVLGPIAPEVSRSFGSDVATVMMATAAFGLGAAISSLFLAPRIDRFGAHRMLRLAMTLMPIALAVSALSPVVAVLVLAQFAAGIASGVALPAIYASAANMAPRGRESKTIGVVLSGWTLSMVGGVSLAAIVADLTHWRAVYGIVALLAVFALGLLSRVKRPEAPPAAKETSLFAAFGLPGIRPLLLACGAFMTAFYGLYAYLGDYFHSTLGQPVSANGLITLVYSAGFGSAILMGGVVNRVGVRRMLSMALFWVACVYLLLGVMGSGLVPVLCLLAALGFGNYYCINLLIVRLTAIDPAKRGAIMGLYSTVTNLAVFLGTGSFGVVYEGGGFAATAYAAAALTLTAAAASTSRR